jgi:transcriptional regulator with XRE-family HTH domain
VRLGLIAAREAQHLTQQDLADAVHRHRSTITKYEAGACDIPGRVLHQLSVLLHTPMETLLADHLVDPRHGRARILWDLDDSTRDHDRR